MSPGWQPSAAGKPAAAPASRRLPAARRDRGGGDRSRCPPATPRARALATGSTFTRSSSASATSS